MFNSINVKKNNQCFWYFMAPKFIEIFRLRQFDKQAIKFFQINFLNIVNERQRTQFVNNDLIDILIKIKNSGEFHNIENCKLVTQIVMFFAAGYYVINTTLSFLLFQVAANPDI